MSDSDDLELITREMAERLFKVLDEARPNWSPAPPDYPLGEAIYGHVIEILGVPADWSDPIVRHWSPWRPEPIDDERAHAETIPPPVDCGGKHGCGTCQGCRRYKGER